jgi:hypothetical protein
MTVSRRLVATSATVNASSSSSVEEVQEVGMRCDSDLNLDVTKKSMT